MLQIKPAFDTYPDTDGQPLNAGYVYIGSKGLNPEIESNQISVYWDSDLKVPAAQPVRTINGFASNNGRPGNLYTGESNYSITVRDISSSLVYSKFSVNAVDQFRVDFPVSISSSSSQVYIIGPNGILTIDGVGTFSGKILIEPGGQLVIDAASTFTAAVSNYGTIEVNAAADFQAPVKCIGGVFSGTANPTFSSDFKAGIYHVFTGSGTPVLSKTKIIFPEWWGAVGDETTDDATALLACINALSSGGEIVYTKRYKSSQNSQEGIFGVQKDGVTLRFIGDAGFTPATNFIPSGSGFLFTLGDSTGSVQYKNIHVIGGRFDGDQTNQVNPLFGIGIKNIKNFTVKRGDYHNFGGSGGSARLYSDGTISKCRFRDCATHGLETKDQGTSQGCFYVVEDCIFEGNTKLGVDITDDINLTYASYTNKTILKNCIFRDNGASPNGQLKVTNCVYALIEACIFEHSTPSTIPEHIRVASTYTAGLKFFGHVIIKDCEFNGDVGTYHIFNEGEGDQLDIIGNRFKNASVNTSTYVVSRSPGTIERNKFFDGPSSFALQTVNSDVSIINNYFEVDVVPIKIESTASFDFAVNTDLISIRGNKFKLTGNVVEFIGLYTATNTTMKGVQIKDNQIIENGFSLTELVLFITADAGAGAPSIVGASILDNQIEGTFRTVFFTGSGIGYASNIEVARNSPDLAVTFTDGDTTPDVSAAETFVTANTGATTISDFDGSIEGKEIWIRVNDANTTFDFTSSALKGNNGVDYVAAANDMIHARLLSGIWYCLIIQG